MLSLAAGATKILFSVPLIYIILVKYTIALIITFFAPDDFTSVAWDSAGVTTGPVTVPFVLSLGVGFSKAVGASEGFGMLTSASVAPIISVLLTNLFKAPAQRAVKTLSGRLKSLGSVSLASNSSALSRISRRANRPDAEYTEGAIENVAAAAAMAAQLELTGSGMQHADTGGATSTGGWSATASSADKTVTRAGAGAGTGSSGE